MLRILFIFTQIVIFAQMFIVGQHLARCSSRDIYLRLQPLWRSLAPVLFLVPLATFSLIILMRPPPEVTLGLAILAAAPGAPVTTRRAETAGADMGYVSALQLTLALVAPVFLPATLGLFDWAFDISPPAITPGTVTGQVAIVTFVPAALGWFLSRFAPEFSQHYDTVISRAAKALFVALLNIVFLALIFVPELRAMLFIGWTGSLALLSMVSLAIVFGHTFGGKRADRRSGLAIAAVARNLGLALYIAELSPVSVAAIPTILSYALVGNLLALPYSKWIKRQSDAAHLKREPLCG
jgi:BASS family bile acid:Na+ symporter